jgi:hypothetical protein
MGRDGLRSFRHGWEYNIKIDLGLRGDCIYLAQVRVQ